jgi:uncharacterized membrane protein
VIGRLINIALLDSRMKTLILMACAALSVLFVWINIPIIPFRVIVSIPTLLFSPGYFILKLNFAKGLDRLEFLLLSVGLSLAITGVWAVTLDELGLPVLPLIVGLPLVVIILIAGGVDLWRQKQRS